MTKMRDEQAGVPLKMESPAEYLTIEYRWDDNGFYTTPDSFGEGARSRFERNGSCFFMRCP